MVVARVVIGGVVPDQGRGGNTGDPVNLSDKTLTLSENTTKKKFTMFFGDRELLSGDFYFRWRPSIVLFTN